ncbi:MAG: efflux RND transporter periplasmic adaptor subunit [Chloroflexi bacterium]|nr:efflux RND transporter periplasmic adaptor subunit [Chloroflexota bacterium]
MRNRIARIPPVVGLIAVLVVLVVGFFAFRGVASPGLAPTAMPTEASARAADLGVVSAEGAVVPVQRVSLAFTVGGRVAAIPVREGDLVKQGTVLARLDDATMQKQVAQAQAQLRLATSQLEQVRVGGTDADVASGQAALAAANESYAKVKAGPTMDELGQLKANLDSAKGSVDQAQAAYDRAGGASNPLISLEPQALALQQADSAFDAALAAWNDARSHPTASELAAAQAQVQQAADALARLTPTQQALDVAQAQVDAAQAALDLARAQAADYALVAPFDGTVANKGVDLGQVVQPGTLAFDLGDLSRLQVETTDLSEVDVTNVQVGQTARTDVRRAAGKSFDGVVKSIAPEANDHRGDQVYEVTIDLPDAAKADVRWGMTANVSIQTSR